MAEEKSEDTAKKQDPPKEEKTLFVWESPTRPFKRRDSRYFVNIALLLVLIGAIALFFQEFLLLGVLLALFFYFYVSGTVAPQKTDHKITNQGITSANHNYIWSDLTDFWFSEKYGEVILTVGTKMRFPGRLIMIVPFIDRDKVKKILIQYISFREQPPTEGLDRMVGWFTNRLPASMR